MNELINTHYERHKSWHRKVAYIIRWVVLLAHLLAVAALALIQTDLTIVSIAAAEGLLQELG
jgi:hypothetical protein